MMKGIMVEVNELMKKIRSGNIIEKRNATGKIENIAFQGEDISKFVEELERSLEDKDKWVSMSSSEALIHHYIKEKKPDKIKRFLQNNEVEVRKLAAISLARYYLESKNSEEIKKMLEENNEEIRKYIKWVVGTKFLKDSKHK